MQTKLARAEHAEPHEIMVRERATGRMVLRRRRSTLHTTDSPVGTRFLLGDRVRASRYSMYRLAQVCAISHPTMRKLVRGELEMFRLGDLDRLAWALGCEVKDFFAGTPVHPVIGRPDMAIPLEDLYGDGREQTG